MFDVKSALRTAIGSCLLLGTAIVAEPAQAGFIGATVVVTANFPDTSTVEVDAGDLNVSGLVEYPVGTFAGYNSSWQIDITDSQIIITNAGPSNGFPFSDATFNGFILTVLIGPEIAAAVVDGASDFAPAEITVVGGNQIQLNFRGVDAPNGEELSSIINVRFDAVPEPTTLALFGAGILAAAGMRRRGSVA